MIEVEDGTAKPNAESYASVASADAYFSARGYTLWTTMSEAEKEQALRRATDHMVQAYRERWQGDRYTLTQALDWPRSLVEQEDGSYYATNVVPREVVSACIFLAFKAASGDLAPDLTQPVKREKVGPIEVEYGNGSQKVRYQSIDNMLAHLLTGSSSTIRLVRA